MLEFNTWRISVMCNVWRCWHGSHMNKDNPYLRLSLLYADIPASNKTVWRKIARNLSCPQIRCARLGREASGLIHSTLPDSAATVAYVSRKKYVFTRYSLLLSQKGLQALLSLQQPCLYVLIWYPNGRFRQQFRPTCLFCVRSLCCLNIWYREYCLVGDVVNVLYLITVVSSVVICSSTFMVNIDFGLTLIYFSHLL
jgi:hypothetical protein